MLILAVTLTTIVAVHVVALGLVAVGIAFPNPFLRLKYLVRDRHRRPGGAVDVSVQLDGRLSTAWLMSGRGDRPVVLVCHGRSRCKNHMVPLVESLGRDFDVLAIDLRSHGQNQYGSVTYGIREADDVEAAVSYLAGRGYVQIGIYGVSMGGAAVLRYLSLEGAEGCHLIRAVALDGVYATVEAVFRSFFATYFVPRCVVDLAKRLVEKVGEVPFVQVRPVDWIADVPVPLLIVHGSDDPLVPLEASSSLFSSAGGAKRLHVYRGRHDRPENREMQREVARFFKEALPSATHGRVLCDRPPSGLERDTVRRPAELGGSSAVWLQTGVERVTRGRRCSASVRFIEGGALRRLLGDEIHRRLPRGGVLPEDTPGPRRAGSGRRQGRPERCRASGQWVPLKDRCNFGRFDG